MILYDDDLLLSNNPLLTLFSQVVAVPDLFLSAVKLTHDKTGAKYLHAARDDSNNLFRLVSPVPHISNHVGKHDLKLKHDT